MKSLNREIIELVLSNTIPDYYQYKMELRTILNNKYERNNKITNAYIDNLLFNLGYFYSYKEKCYDYILSSIKQKRFYSIDELNHMFSTFGNDSKTPNHQINKQLDKYADLSPIPYKIEVLEQEYMIASTIHNILIDYLATVSNSHGVQKKLITFNGFNFIEELNKDLDFFASSILGLTSYHVNKQATKKEIEQTKDGINDIAETKLLNTGNKVETKVQKKHNEQTAIPFNVLNTGNKVETKVQKKRNVQASNQVNTLGNQLNGHNVFLHRDNIYIELAYHLYADDINFKSRKELRSGWNIGNPNIHKEFLYFRDWSHKKTGLFRMNPQNYMCEKLLDHEIKSYTIINDTIYFILSKLHMGLFKSTRSEYLYKSDINGKNQTMLFQIDWKEDEHADSYGFSQIGDKLFLFLGSKYTVKPNSKGIYVIDLKSNSTEKIFTENIVTANVVDTNILFISDNKLYSLDTETLNIKLKYQFNKDIEHAYITEKELFFTSATNQEYHNTINKAHHDGRIIKSKVFDRKFDSHPSLQIFGDYLFYNITPDINRVPTITLVNTNIALTWIKTTSFK